MPDRDQPLLARLQELAAAHPRAGCRRVTQMLRAEGWRVNQKRVHRLWKAAGLQVKRKQTKKRRLGTSENGCVRLKAAYRGHLWSYDFVFDRTDDGKQLKLMPVIDEFTRECHAILVARSITAKEVTRALGEVFDAEGVPENLRSDNGSEFIAEKVKTYLRGQGVQTRYIEPGAPGRMVLSKVLIARSETSCWTGKSSSTWRGKGSGRAVRSRGTIVRAPTTSQPRTKQHRPPDCHPDQGGATDSHRETTPSAAARRDLLSQQRTPADSHPLPTRVFDFPSAPKDPCLRELEMLRFAGITRGEGDAVLVVLSAAFLVALSAAISLHSPGSVILSEEKDLFSFAAGERSFAPLQHRSPEPNSTAPQTVIPTKAAALRSAKEQPHPPPRGETSSTQHTLDAAPRNPISARNKKPLRQKPCPAISSGTTNPTL